MPLSSVLFSSLPSPTLLLTSYKCYSHSTLWPSSLVPISLQKQHFFTSVSHHSTTWLDSQVCAPSEQPWRIICHLLLSPLDFQWCQLWSTGNFFRTKRWCDNVLPEWGIDNVPWFISEATQQPAHKVFCWNKSCVLLYTIMVWAAQHGSPDWLEGLLSGSHVGKYHPLEVCKTSILPE